MAELVYAYVSEAYGVTHESSNLSMPTKHNPKVWVVTERFERRNNIRSRGCEGVVSPNEPQRVRGETKSLHAHGFNHHLKIPLIIPMIKAVIFDIDGVFLDSKKDSAKYFQKILKAVDHRSITLAEYDNYFHLTALDALRAMIGSKNIKAVNKTWNIFATQSIPYPGETQKLTSNSAKIVKQLSKNYKLALVTSRVRQSVFMSHELAKLKKYFQVAISVEDTKKHKPDPAPLLLAAKKMKLKVSECIYVGDMPSDITAAHSAGMKVVQFSKFSKIIIPDADAYVNSFKQLPKLIKNLTQINFKRAI